MAKRSLKALSAAAIVGLSFGLVACSSDSPAENTAAACTAYDGFAAAFASAQETINGSATVGEIKAARDTLADSYKTLSEALGAVAEDRAEEVNAAWDNLDGAINDIKDDQTVADATAGLTEEFAAIQKSQDDAYAALGCS